ncbi:MAG: TonB-dependent receptor [Deltaproteobacteria bacterium]
MAWFAPSAHADELRDALERAPGTVGDPVAVTAETALAVLTPEGLSVDGAMPYEIRTLVDGFETPIFHLDGRSALTWWGGAQGLDREPGVGRSNGVAQLDTTTTWPREWNAAALTLTTVDAQLAYNTPGRRVVARAWWPRLTAPANLERTDLWPHFDGQGAVYLVSSRHLVVCATLFAMVDHEAYDAAAAHPDHHVASNRSTTRATFEEIYRRGAWTEVFSQSVLTDDDRHDVGTVQHHHDSRVSLDSRNELVRALRAVAGLAKLAVKIGAEANITRHDLSISDARDPHEDIPTTGIVAPDDLSHRFDGTIWTTDLGAWTSATAQLASNVRATTGLRADAFGTDVAVQPRGELDVDVADHVSARLAAGAYRRAPEHADELEHTELHPERASRVAFGVGRWLARTSEGAFANAAVYYVDRTNLVEDDGTGKLANTGRGTTYGVHGTLGLYRDHWFALAALVLEHSDRQQSPTMRTRPFEYDQPVRLDLRVTRFLGAWQLGAHFSLREGLPYTRVAGAHYDSDRDVYLPDFATLYAERLPWQHQLDLRVDRSLGSHLRAYLDIANVYDHRAAIGWDYNFNFTERRAITAPEILPTVGLRGEL